MTIWNQTQIQTYSIILQLNSFISGVCSSDLTYFSIFQEYKLAFEMLRDAYFSKVTDFDGIKRANIALLSDINFVDGIIKLAKYQTIINNAHSDASQRKNTFIYRYSFS